MGIIKDTLLPSSAYAARKVGTWEALTDDLYSCLYLAAIDRFVERIDNIEHTLPSGWRELLDEEVEKQRIAIADDDISQIMRNFDFT